MKERVLCAHGYVLMQDSCPGCDHESENPHPADAVSVVPSWSDRSHTRCRRCGKRPSNRIHTKGGTGRA
ncbi:hypothetical protein SAMN05444921_11312 [Streptomyces wuyuanensis]|uniref:Uncharacterized protein n=1 Tax=Streptomyces wuyuanensis TaxID=1196353 RepID=A0A1G9VVY6_9ACTN|nr:hypothetical protein SAMN05444921_11312 [Streptomyces wuyuanensis]